jgi:hypothetical protein
VEEEDIFILKVDTIGEEIKLLFTAVSLASFPP